MLADSPGVYIPYVYQEYSTRRLLVSEWVDGIKLTQAAPEDIRRLTKVAQECFLRQLLEFGACVRARVCAWAGQARRALLGITMTTRPASVTWSVFATHTHTHAPHLFYYHQSGLFHCDAHPGNLLLMSDTTKGELALLDFGLISEISEDDREVRRV